jgi:hypothetical protein
MLGLKNEEKPKLFAKKFAVYLDNKQTFYNLKIKIKIIMEICKNYNECIKCTYYEECGEKACIEKGRLGPGIPIVTMLLVFYLIFQIF